MARFLPAFALIPLLSFATVTAQPAMPAPEPAEQGGKAWKKDRGPGGDSERHLPLPSPNRDDPFLRFKKKLDTMSPEERKHFQDNWKRWREMGEGERRDWQKRAMEERARLKQNVADAIARIGLQLDDDQREVFALRYHQERRKLEQGLCEEMKKKREAGIEEMLSKLKTEFSTAGAAGSPIPAATPQ